MSHTTSGVALAQIGQYYRAMGGMLATAAEHAKAHGVEESVYLNWRLAADMFPLVRQVQIATDFGIRGLSRLAGTDPVSLPDTETSFAELQARLTKAMEVISGLDTAAIDADPAGDVTFPAGRDQTMTLPRGVYATNAIIPNVGFHASMTYAILRRIGVPLGKRDFMGL
ncbi:DUF1993 domain-containing protein [Hyphobacterium marinum]|uniref:DUF1993 domain-containing protein n=1 Tax=Hyphobacterium marinum TaxID=3116574 RepID=A0ABU7LZ27_9PROT|nr:DUF1993 domain-containing protein [Hyphobacterium sp. Y6023]MEE2566813.1 DUF1993 domain-containing protein [Hyphobacterium sp. Y6023]